MDVLLRKVTALVERSFISENLRPICFCKDCHFFSRMKFLRPLSIRARREAQSQPAPRRVQRSFHLDTRELDFVSITPGQAGWLVAQVAVPSQRPPQRKEAPFHKRDHIVCTPRLLCNANSQETKHCPAE